jgi:membrane protease subunit HflK
VLTTGREKIATDVKVRLAQYLEAYDTGIGLSKVNVEDAKAPSEVQASFDNVSKAREDEERVKNEAQTYVNQVVPEARGKSLRMLEEAKGYRDQTISKAEGEASRFKKLLAEYRKAPGVTRERLYLDTMQQVMQSNTKVMIDVKGGNNMMYLPLDKLMQNSLPAEPGSNAATGAPTQADMDEMKKQLEELKNSINNSSSSRRRESRQ